MKIKFIKLSISLLFLFALGCDVFGDLDEIEHTANPEFDIIQHFVSSTSDGNFTPNTGEEVNIDFSVKNLTNVEFTNVQFKFRNENISVFSDITPSSFEFDFFSQNFVTKPLSFSLKINQETPSGDYCVYLDFFVEGVSFGGDSICIQIIGDDVFFDMPTFELDAQITQFIGGQKVVDHIIDSYGNIVIIGTHPSGSVFYRLNPLGEIDKMNIIEKSILAIAHKVGSENYILSAPHKATGPGAPRNDLLQSDLDGEIVISNSVSIGCPNMENLICYNNLILYSGSLSLADGVLCSNQPCSDCISLVDEAGSSFTPDYLRNTKDKGIDLVNDIEVDQMDRILISGFARKCLSDIVVCNDREYHPAFVLYDFSENKNILIDTTILIPNSKHSKVVDSKIDANGNIYHVIHSLDIDTTISIYKTTASGDSIWWKPLHLNDNFHPIPVSAPVPVSIDIDEMGNLVIVGYGNFEDGGFGSPSGTKIFMTKINQGGDNVWMNPPYRTFGRQGTINVPVKIIVHEDGGYVVSATSNILDFDESSGEFTLGNLYVFKTSQEGIIK